MTRLSIFCFFPVSLLLLFSWSAHAAFTDHGDGTISDTATGLMWDKCSWGQSANDCSGGAASTHTWLAALGVAVTANGSSHKGYSDWRLPSRTELESLVKIDTSSPAIDGTAFPNTPSATGWFLSSTTYAPDPANAWGVKFSDGYSIAYIKTNVYRVRLVRSGQTFASFDSQPGIAYSATTFSEAGANDGSIDTSVTLTLSRDTYVADVVSANRITASNVPAGLAANFVRTSDTVITATLTGNATAHANANDIANMTFTFADGAFTTTGTAANVTNYAKNNLVVDFADPTADTTPDAYTFTAQTGAARSTVTTSNAITVAGIDSAAAISISGGEYSVSTDGGTNWSAWSTTTPATVSVNHQIKVRLTTSASYSTAATATLTIGGVNGTFSVTTEAAPSSGGSYDPPPPPTTLTVSANGSGTLTSSITQVTVNGGATLIIPATIAAAGVTLNLPAPSSGAASPVTLTLNGQSLNITPGGAGTVLRVTSATVTLNGVPTVVQLVSLSAGSITVSGSGQTLLSIGSGATPRLLASGGNQAVTALATLDAASGDTLLAVSGGMVVLPAANTATRSAAATQTEIHAGETVTFDSAGQLKTHRVGSTSGSGGAGDPLAIANRPATLTLDATLSNLKGGLARLGGQSPEQAALALLGADFTLGNGGQTAAGVLPLTVGQSTLHLLPLGPFDIDASQPDGVSLTADGLYQFVRNGVLMRFAPSVRDSRQLAGDLASTFSGAATTLHNDGVIVVRVGGVDFVMQPDLSAESGSGNAMGFDFDGEGHLRYRDAQGYRQVLHPAFADLATLRDILTAAIPGIVVNRNNGATTAAIGDVIYTLVPDYTLTGAPAEQAGRSWWSGADGKLYIRNADGTAQGFAVR